jgi:lysophospholipase L1-like esterase
MHRSVISLLLLIWVNTAFGQPSRVTFFGSSVCYGSGAEQNHGYAWQLFHSGAIDTTRFKYFNASTGGDNTLKVEKEERLTKKLFPTHPDMVVIGLSLGNEGILTPKHANGREQVLEQYRSRLLALADSLRSLGMQPILVNCYANAHFDQDHYQITQRMNRLINTWHYPSVNVLGTVDDGSGKWAPGLEADPLHPNTTGHREMSYAFVPSLFETLRQGKKTPSYDWHPSYATMMNSTRVAQPLLIQIPGTLHSFTLSFRFKDAGAGSIAGYVAGTSHQTIQFDGTTLSYRELSKSHTPPPQGWTHIVLSHSYANQLTSLYIDGELVGSVQEQLSPTQVHYGGTTPHMDLKDLMLHRSALNNSEALDLFTKKFIQSSLEFYNPLTEAIHGGTLGNRAQSLTPLHIQPAVDIHHSKVDF